MANDVKFQEGTSSQYANITPDEHTFYKITNGSSIDVYLGSTILNSNLPSNTVGTVSTPIYLSSGTLTTLTSTIGGTTKPVYLNAGTFTAMTSTVGGTSRPVYMSNGTFSACTATIGTVSIPVYMSSGRFYSCSSWWSTVASQLQDLDDRVTALEPIKIDDIQSIVQSGQAANTWVVGDVTEDIVLNGTVGERKFNNEKWRALIIGIDHNKSQETGGQYNVCFQFGTTSDGVNVVFDCDCYMYQNGYNYGGWASSTARTQLCSEFFNALPTKVQNIVGTTTKYTDNEGYIDGKYYASSVTATQDKIFLLSCYEASGLLYGNNTEGSYQQTYEYYASGISRRERYAESGNSTASWWTRSCDATAKNLWCGVDASGNANSNTFASDSLGFCPAFTVF